MSETEPSAACINEFNDFEECVIEGFINNTPLFQEFVDAYKASEDCFENAADEAAVAICEEPLWVISAQACPSGIDPLIAACDDDETHSMKFGDFALGVFLKDGELLMCLLVRRYTVTSPYDNGLEACLSLRLYKVDILLTPLFLPHLYTRVCLLFNSILFNQLPFGKMKRRTTS